MMTFKSSISFPLINEAGSIFYQPFAINNLVFETRIIAGDGLPDEGAAYIDSGSVYLDSPDGAGNSWQTALDLGSIDPTNLTSETFSDGVGADDIWDYYRFTLPNPSNFDLHLYGLEANANLYFADATGQVIARSTKNGNLAESITVLLEAGTYYFAVRSASQVNTPYNLTFTALERSPIESPTLQEFIIPPQATDGTIDQKLDPHYVAVDEAVEDNQKLFLFLAGTRAKPIYQQLIVQEAAALGYHAINLSYPNSISMTALCRDSTDGDCFEKARREILDGNDRSELVDISPANSMENRIVKLLHYLDRQHPEQGWSQYLEGDTPKWDSIVVAGHSQGGGHAAMIAKEHEVDRLVMFAPELDFSKSSQTFAPWLYEPKATPPDRYYGFIHGEDTVFDLERQLDAWQILGLDASGAAINVDGQMPPYNYSHQLITYVPPAFAGTEHSSVVSDRVTPKSADGTPLFDDIWRYLLSDNQPV